MKKPWFLPGILLLLLAACSPSARPIEYGADKCDFCRMTIVDPRYAAEAVTTKGRVYKFDAIECLIRYRQQETERDFALLLVGDYSGDGTLRNADECTFLVSPNLPSPMGANICAFAGREAAQKIQAEQGGELFTWEELMARKE